MTNPAPGTIFFLTDAPPSAYIGHLAALLNFRNMIPTLRFWANRVFQVLSAIGKSTRRIWNHDRVCHYRKLGVRWRASRCLRIHPRKMRVVRLLGNFPGLWQRSIEQTPGGSCQWGNTLFVADGPADIYLVLNSIIRPLGSRYIQPDFAWPERERVWGLHMEPSEYVHRLGYDLAEEHDHISRFYTNCDYLIERGGIYKACPPYVHSHVGNSWDFLNHVGYCPERHRFGLGLICSHMNDIEGHKTRLEFLERLDKSGIPYALWGRGEALKRFRGYQGFAISKWAAHSQCRYTIVMENTVSPWYWTEKPADCLLSFSMPLYHGCPNLGNYLPKESFIPIDIRRPDCIEAIREVLHSDTYSERLNTILEARQI